MADDHSDKAPDAYRTISEVAEDLDLPQHVLRFWETRFSQIKPLKRGGGRRYYRPDDVALITGIRELLYGQGFTIKGVQKILRDNGAKHVQAAGRGSKPAPPQIIAVPGPADIDVPARQHAEAPAPLQGSASASALLAVALAELTEARRVLHAARHP